MQNWDLDSIEHIEEFKLMLMTRSNKVLGIASISKGGISDKYLTIHPALQQGFLKIYEYSGDSDGIRHGLVDESTVSLEDAQFLLISCSSFINYLIVKASKSGLINNWA